jgi:outer membrane protein
MQSTHTAFWTGRVPASGAVAAGLVLALFMALAPQALATDIVDIGFVDQQALGSLKPFVDAQRQFAQYRGSMNGQFMAAVKGKSDADKQKIFNDFNQKLAAKQHELFDQLLARAQTAIAAVAANKSLGVVVDKQIVVFGGQEITGDVIALFNQPGQVVPPVNTPPASEVGYVDQSQLDALPKFKAANDEFIQYRQKLGVDLTKQSAGKTDAQKQQIVDSFNKQLADEQKKVIQPIIDQTQKAISDVARKKNLMLVIDMADRVYGGTDVTADVVAALK